MKTNPMKPQPANESKHTPVYEVTSEGRVFSTSNWRGYGRRELAQHPNKSGYPSVRLVIDGKREHLAVHVLVARKYLQPQPSELHEIRHLDGNKLNASFFNLAWGTRKENADDREQHGRTSRGKSHSAKIKASNQADGTRAFRAAQKARAAIAKARP